MDTSEKYIELCKQATEIQNAWIPEYGDFYADRQTIRNVGTRHEKEFVCKRPLPIPFVWLPRIDQLQSMLKNTHTLGAILQGLYSFYDTDEFCPEESTYKECKCEEIGILRRKMFDSIEQFQLAFLMDELYKKEWTGTEWKEIGGPHE